MFYSLETLDCNRATTNLLVLVDGPIELFVEVRNRVEMSKFAKRLCIHFGETTARGIPERRERIAAIHNKAKTYIWESEFIFGLEDDTAFLPNTLSRLLKDYSIHPFAGMIEGVQVGRWGLPYIGAWKTDDVYNPNEFESLTPEKGIEEIDFGGFYCFLTRTKDYIAHEFTPYEDVLGPDANYGLYLRRKGYSNYIDWDINCGHRTERGEIKLKNVTPAVANFKKYQGSWTFRSRIENVQ